MRRFHDVKASLADLLGAEYVGAVCSARAYLSDGDLRSVRALARLRVTFYPLTLQRRLDSLLPRIGTRCSAPLRASAAGAASSDFDAHTNTQQAPLSALGFYRIGEDGRLFLTAKSEHYHVPLGHRFPGYRLVELARRLGIPNATHNNTRGHVTRLLEETLVCAAAGIDRDDAGLTRLRRSRAATVLNRVLNLETGSLAAEAALKMILSRFYKTQPDSPPPLYAGRVPVILVIGDDDGGVTANYHGTTILTQALRGMWPELRTACEQKGVFLVRAVRPNDMGALDAAFAKYETGRRKIAGCFHELVLMNYGGKRLTESFVARLYALCRQHDVPTVVDEIQTGIWSPELFLYREYGVKPAMVVVGKGFPGGEYAASRVLFSAAMDALPQFGALVTNGQEELASLTYLITMRWAQANADVTRTIGEYYESRLHELAGRYRHAITAVEGRRHLAGIYFHDLATAKAFVRHLNAGGVDISAQTYKSGCPPSALTKLPLTATAEVVDVLIAKMDAALRRI